VHLEFSPPLLRASGILRCNIVARVARVSCDVGLQCILVLGDPRYFASGGLGQALSVELEDPLPLGLHQETTSLLYRRPLVGDLGDALEYG
jgi:hypothetical protein